MKTTAKDFFNLISNIGETNNDNFSVYVIENNEDEIRFRVDCGKIGSFEISKLSGEEEYSLNLNDWIWVDGVVYRYHSCSTKYGGYPYLPIEKAYNFIKKHNI